MILCKIDKLQVNYSCQTYAALYLKISTLQLNILLVFEAATGGYTIDCTGEGK